MERFSVRVCPKLEIFSFQFLRCKAVHVYVLLLDSMTFLSPEHSSVVVLSRWLLLRSGTVFQSIPVLQDYLERSQCSLVKYSLAMWEIRSNKRCIHSYSLLYGIESNRQSDTQLVVRRCWLDLAGDSKLHSTMLKVVCICQCVRVCLWVSDWL